MHIFCILDVSVVYILKNKDGEYIHSYREGSFSTRWCADDKVIFTSKIKVVLDILRGLSRIWLFWAQAGFNWDAGAGFRVLAGYGRIQE